MENRKWKIENGSVMEGRDLLIRKKLNKQEELG